MRVSMYVAGLAFAAGLTLAGAAGAQPLAIGEALERAQVTAGSVRGARLNAQARSLQAEALRNIHHPSIALTGFTGRARTSFNIDTTQAMAAAAPTMMSLAQLPGFQPPHIPTSIALDREYSLHSLSVGGVLPLYTGGRLDAARDVALGRAAEAQAELVEEEDKSAGTVIQRYFQVQLARHALEVRQAAVAGVQQHLDAARRLEAIGLIARAERLKADVALADAQREASKAASDLEIARVAFSRLLDVPGSPVLSTPLFVHTQPVGSLESFIATGLQEHPGWSRIAAKRAQADAARRLAGSEHSPTLLGVGSYNFNRGSDKLVQPAWFVGVMLRVPLIGPVDKKATAEAARLDEERVDVAEEQARRDIPTLVENQWRSMENARATVLAMEPQIALAQEHLRLQDVAFRQQQATALDVIDARLNVAKVQVQRSQAAYEYVMALARLLEATGQPERLATYAQTAEVQVKPGRD